MPTHQNSNDQQGCTSHGTASTKANQQLQGVSFDTVRRTYKARIHFAGKERYVGRYKTQVAAARAYDQAARHINTLIDATEFDSKRRTRSLNFPDQQVEDARLAKRLKAKFTADMMNSAADPVAETPQPGKAQRTKGLVSSEASACAAQSDTNGTQDQAPMDSADCASRDPAACRVAAAQERCAYAAADMHAAALHARSVLAGGGVAAQRVLISSGLQQQHHHQDGTAHADSQQLMSGTWLQQQQQLHLDGGRGVPAAAVSKGQVQQQAGYTEALSDPCSMPLLPVDALDGADWQHLLAAVGTGAAGTIAAAPASQMQRMAVFNSTALTVPGIVPSAALAGSVAASQMLPLLLGAQHQGVPSLYGTGESGQGTQAVVLAATAAEWEQAPLAQSILGSRHGQMQQALASGAPAAAVPAAAGMSGAAAFLPILTPPAVPAWEFGTAHDGHTSTQSPGTAATAHRSLAPRAGWSSDMQLSGSAAGPGVRAPHSNGLLSCVTTPLQALELTGQAAQSLRDMAGYLLQQHHQDVTINPLQLFADWLHAAWCTDVVGSGALCAEAMPRAIAAGVTAAKSALPDAAAPNRLVLLMLERLLAVLLESLDWVRVGTTSTVWDLVFGVLQMLQRGLAAVDLAVQSAVAAEPHVHAVNMKQLLQAHVALQHVPWHNWHDWVVSTLMLFVSQL